MTELEVAGALVPWPQLRGTLHVAAFAASCVVGALFGYHELFHALTILALGCQYVAIAFFIVHVREV